MTLAEIDLKFLEGYVTNLSKDKKLSPTSIAMTIRTLKAFLNQQVRYGLMEKNPAVVLILPIARKQGLLDSAFVYAQKAENFLDDNISDGDQIFVRDELTALFGAQSDFEKARFHGEIARDLYLQSGNIQGVLGARQIMAFIYDNLARPSDAMAELQAVADLAESAGFTAAQGRAIMNMGNMFASRGVLLEAAEKYELALELFKETGDTYSMMGLQINLGNLNKIQHHYQEGIQNLTRARGLADSLKDIRTRANIISSLGSVYLEMGQLDSARTFFSQSLKVCDELNLFPGQLMNHISLSQTENDARNYSQALFYAQHARLMIGNKPILHELVKTHKNLHRAYEGLGDYKRALGEFRLMATLEDSLDMEASKKQILEMTLKYETEKKKKEILALQQESLRKSERTRRIVLSAGFLILTLVLILIIYIQRIRISRKQNIIIEQERDAIARELELRNRELVEYVHNMTHMSRLLNQVKPPVEIENQTETDRVGLLEKLDDALSVDKGLFNWAEFETRFHSLHPQFIQKLSEKYPDLTPAQNRLAMFIRMNLPTKEIAYVTNKSTRTIESTRYTMRQKLGLEKYESLSTVIQHL